MCIRDRHRKDKSGNEEVATLSLDSVTLERIERHQDVVSKDTGK